MYLEKHETSTVQITIVSFIVTVVFCLVVIWLLSGCASPIGWSRIDIKVEAPTELVDATTQPYRTEGPIVPSNTSAQSGTTARGVTIIIGDPMSSKQNLPVGISATIPASTLGLGQ